MKDEHILPEIDAGFGLLHNLQERQQKHKVYLTKDGYISDILVQDEKKRWWTQNYYHYRNNRAKILNWLDDSRTMLWEKLDKFLAKSGIGQYI
ncbi:MAG: hypothetical protein INF43_04915 [Alphaproteobacteria bacterium]|nr:hypothetical protein [Alphaproteobacteria bacterium]